MITPQKSDGGTGRRLPRQLPEQAGLREKSEVERDRLVIRPRPKLADLLTQCRAENRPEHIDFGPPAGREMI